MIFGDSFSPSAGRALLARHYGTTYVRFNVDGGTIAQLKPGVVLREIVARNASWLLDPMPNVERACTP